MAESEEDVDDDKTEEPTQRRLEEARKEGQFAFSKEVNHCFILMGSLGVFAILPQLCQDLFKILRSYIEYAPLIHLGSSDVQFFCVQTTWHFLRFLAFPFAILVFVLLLASFSQSQFVFKKEIFEMDVSKISPLKGFQRIFSKKSLFEFFKGFLKIITVLLIFFILFKAEVLKFAHFMASDLIYTLQYTNKMNNQLFLSVLWGMIALAAVDYFKERFEFLNKLRMTRQAIKEEIKQAEGDPTIRAKLRQLRRQRGQRRMMAAVPSATVVITNPTHYAIALKFDQTTMASPKMVAKGLDLIAQKIREVALENGVPIVQNPPLAQALYRQVEIDEEIPPFYYEAVAQVISYVLQTKKT